MAVEDAVKGRGKRKKAALDYLAGDDFKADCKAVRIDPKDIGRLVIEMLNTDEDERGAEITRLKRMVRGS